MKRLILLLVFLLALPLLNSLDSELYQSCGGDEQLIIGCIGDDELMFLSKISTTTTTPTSSEGAIVVSGGVGGGYTLESPLIEVQLKPHYYKDGKEVSSIQSTNNIVQISFDVSATNDGEEITDIIIYDASPIDFKQAFPSTTQTLGTETKLLWTSDIISISNFSEDIGIIFSVVIKGKRNNVNVFGEGKIIVSSKRTKYNLFKTLGEKIYPDDYRIGIAVILLLGILLIFLFWRFKIYSRLKKPLDNWRNNEKQKREFTKNDKMQE